MCFSAGSVLFNDILMIEEDDMELNKNIVNPVSMNFLFANNMV